MVVVNTAKCFLRLGRLLGTLVCWVVFFFWASQAFQKFLSVPVSSSISYTNGDDGLGNLVYPAITICPTNFAEKGENAQSYLTSLFIYKNQHCQDVLPAITSFTEALLYCISNGEDQKTTTTTEDYSGGLGGLFGDYGDGVDYTSWDTELFPTIDDLLNATNLEVYDVIKSFKFGEAINDFGLSQELLQSFWIKTFDQNSGPCFTFDPLKQNISSLPSGKYSKGNFWPTQIRIRFKVSRVGTSSSLSQNF